MLNKKTRYLYADLETYSEVPITHGTWAYAEAAEIMLFPYALDDGEVRVWDATEPGFMPEDLENALLDPDVITVWHNGLMFDTVLLRRSGILAGRTRSGVDCFDLPLERIEDTMTQAYMHSLPGALGKLGDVFRLDEDKAKMKTGKSLVLFFCKPRKGKGDVMYRPCRETHPEKWAQFVKYAGLDVEAMRELHRKMPRWNLSPYWLGARNWNECINRRGIAVDRDLIEGAIAELADEKARLAEAMREGTAGVVPDGAKRQQLIDYLEKELGIELPRKKNKKGVLAPDLSASTVERLIESGTLPEEAEDLLLNRLEMCTSSTAKYKRMAQWSSTDGRVRGHTQFCGAGRTGRTAGRGVQLANLPRSTWKQDRIEDGITLLKNGLAGVCFTAAKDEKTGLLSGGVMDLCSQAVRGMLIPSPGCEMHVSDWANIEGRLVAWQADETEVVQYFHDFDAGLVPDEYRVTYANTFGVAVETVTSQQRQVGKAISLSFGYAGGPSAFTNFANVYRVDLEELAAGAPIPDDLRAECWDYLESFVKPKKIHRAGLPDHVYVVCEAIKRLWRARRSRTERLWWELESAAIEVLNGSTDRATAGKVVFDKRGAWLRMRLPSGRYLQYPSAKVDDVRPRKAQSPDGGWDDTGLLRGDISYMGVDQFTRAWQRIRTSGGKLLENATQAISADILWHAIPQVEVAGFRVLGSTYDEIIAEAPIAAGKTHEELSAIMCLKSSWFSDLPIAAKGFTAMRYRKD